MNIYYLHYGAGMTWGLPKLPRGLAQFLGVKTEIVNSSIPELDFVGRPY